MYHYNRKMFYYKDSFMYVCVAVNIAPNEKGLWSGGAFETPLPERPPM